MHSRWFICEGGDFNEGTCFYSERGRASLDKRGHDRCIKHGRLLTHDPSLDGASRSEARRRHSEWERRQQSNDAALRESEDRGRKLAANC